MSDSNTTKTNEKPDLKQSLGEIAQGTNDLRDATNPGAMVVNGLVGIVELPFKIIGDIVNHHGSDATPAPAKSTTTEKHATAPTPGARVR